MQDPLIGPIGRVFEMPTLRAPVFGLSPFTFGPCPENRLTIAQLPKEE